MGRPPKNPSHVLVRLRQAISTDQLTVTRKILGERVGISPATIRDIENGRFKLTQAIALRIMRATGVSTQSLLGGEDPLIDIGGNVLSARSASDGWLSDVAPFHEISLNALLEAAIRASKEKKRLSIFFELFREWLPQAIAAIGATSKMKEVLNSNLGDFEPFYVPTAFHPKDAKMKARWGEAERQLKEVWGIIGEGDPGAKFRAYNDLLSGQLKKKLSGQGTD